MTLSDARRRLRDAVRARPGLHRAVRVLKYGPYRGLVDDRAGHALLDQARREGWRVLHLGSGGRRREGMVNVDPLEVVAPDVVADGHCLPFPDGSFDLIWCEFVIEHVEDPERFLADATRCLRPGGQWFLAVPFLQPFHAGVDFQRWTLPGFQAALRRAGLQPMAAGPYTGPGFMLAWLLREVLAFLFSLGWAPLRAVLDWPLRWLFAPLLLLDLLLRRRPGVEAICCDIWHIARRPD